MNADRSFKRNVYYSHDHEWIDFQGTVAYVGVCAFKLTGFKSIDRIVFSEPADVQKAGDVIAVVVYRDYQVPVCMPVDGKVIDLNQMLVNGDGNVLLTEPQNNGWIALIVPAEPQERLHLLLPEAYERRRCIKLN